MSLPSSFKASRAETPGGQFFRRFFIKKYNEILTIAGLLQAKGEKSPSLANKGRGTTERLLWIMAKRRLVDELQKSDVYCNRDLIKHTVNMTKRH